MSDVELPRDLGEGLLLRPARPEDGEELAGFASTVFGEGEEGPDEQAAAWIRDLLRGDHPTSEPGDGTVVVDTGRDRLVSSCCCIRQTWSYGAIPFGVSRPEMIATDPDYRGRGLVRAQLDVLHAASAARGDLVQALSGIPHFYGQFGYEPALVADPNPLGSPLAIPDVSSGEAETYRVRPAVEGDVPLIARLYAKALAGVPIGAVRDEAIWRYEMARNPASDYWHELRIVETIEGNAVGFFAYPSTFRSGTLQCTLCEVEDGVPWPPLAPVVLRALRTAGEEIAARDGERFVEIALGWTQDHPLARIAGGLFPGRGRPFAWYVRIPDVAGFVRHVAPVLERRLAASPMAGYTGEVWITSPRSGLRLAFEAGRLTAAEATGRQPYWESDAGFPERGFLYLLLGSRSVDDLRYAYPATCWVWRERFRLLLDALFPKQASSIWPVA